MIMCFRYEDAVFFLTLHLVFWSSWFIVCLLHLSVTQQPLWLFFVLNKDAANRRNIRGDITIEISIPIQFTYLVVQNFTSDIIFVFSVQYIHETEQIERVFCKIKHTEKHTALQRVVHYGHCKLPNFLLCGCTVTEVFTASPWCAPRRRVALKNFRANCRRPRDDVARVFKGAVIVYDRYCRACSWRYFLQEKRKFFFLLK